MAFFNGKRELMARAFGRPALRPLVRAINRPNLLGLTYHRVCDYDVLDPNVISASFEEFDWQCSFLKDTVRVLSGDELTKIARGELEVTEPSVFITFDDGYIDNLEAGRVLAKHGLSAIFFVTTGFIGSETISHWDRIAYSTRFTEVATLKIPAIRTETGSHGPWTVESMPHDVAARGVRAIYHTVPTGLQERFIESLEEVSGCAAKDYKRKEPLFMTWDHVRELHSLGHDIGAHTQSHSILSRLDERAQLEELEGCRDKIAHEVGHTPTLLAYPNGKPWTFTGVTKSLAQKAGYAAAFSFYGGANKLRSLDTFDIRRGWVATNESRDLFRAKVMFPEILGS